MSEDLTEFIVALLSLADSAAYWNTHGGKFKPMREIPDIIKHGYSVKKKDKKAFAETYNRLRGLEGEEAMTFNQILSQFTSLNEANNQG